MKMKKMKSADLEPRKIFCAAYILVIHTEYFLFIEKYRNHLYVHLVLSH